MLRRLETCFFLLALALFVAVEGSCVYTIWHQPSFCEIPPGSVSICGYRISPTLSQCWLIGGVFILIFRLLKAVRSGGFHGDRTSLRINKSLLHHWPWLLALVLLQGCALYLDSSMPVSR
jgi:hypothetical protein